MNRQVHLIVQGRVQGVCYRMYACEQAEALGLTGWVRNCPDGTVEAVAEGEEEALQRFLAWCRQGPPSATVTGVTASYSDATRAFDGFTVTF